MGCLSLEHIEEKLTPLKVVHSALGSIEKGHVNLYHLKDHLGSVRVEFMDDGTGTAVPTNVTNYYPFGLPWDSDTDTRNNWTYTGQELQRSFDLGLMNYGARFYDPSIGRFMSVDPLAFDYAPYTPYHYVMNNPLKYIDPNGMQVVDPHLIFDGSTNQMYIFDDNDTPDDYTDDVFVGQFKAHNNVSSTSNGKWEDGEYDMLDTDAPYTHGDETDSKGVKLDSDNGAYGSEGIYRAENFDETESDLTRSGMGIHAGRENKDFEKRKTLGRIRCSPEGFDEIGDAIDDYGSLTKIKVINNQASDNSSSAKKNNGLRVLKQALSTLAKVIR